MVYKAVGFAVVKFGKWFLNRRYGHLVPSRKVALAGVAGATVVGAGAVAASRTSA